MSWREAAGSHWALWPLFLFAWWRAPQTDTSAPASALWALSSLPSSRRPPFSYPGGSATLESCTIQRAGSFLLQVPVKKKRWVSKGRSGHEALARGATELTTALPCTNANMSCILRKSPAKNINPDKAEKFTKWSTGVGAGVSGVTQCPLGHHVPFKVPDLSPGYCGPIQPC